MMRFLSRLSRAACGLLLAAAAAGSAVAAEPPITLVVPYPPGGATDLMARTLAQQMGTQMHRSIIVENRAGGGTLIGAQVVSRAAPNGTTLLMATSTTLAINRSLYKSLPYDPERFAPVGMVAEVPLVLVVSPALKVKSLAELVALAKAEPGRLTFGSAGNGSPQHLAGEMFKTEAGIAITHVPYKGTVDALTDLLAGRISMIFADLAPALPQIRAGKLVALAVTSAHRLSNLPDTPTVQETKVPGTADYEAVAWQSLVAPPGTPASITHAYDAALTKVLASKTVQEQFASYGVSVRSSTPEYLGDYIKSEGLRWAKVVRDSGASVN